MKRAFACVLFVITACFSVFSQDQSPPAILVLNSYHRGNPMSDNFLAGIQEELESGLPGADFFYEHMDLKRRTFKQIGAPLKELLSAKYRGRRFHVVITVDNDALDFVVDNRDELFQGVPVVFCGINYYSPDILKGQRGITGVPEAIDMRGTIRLIRTIQPRVKKIQVISDATGTGKLLAEEFRSIKGEFAGERILFEEYFNLSIEEARALLDSGSDETAVLLITYQRDRTGRTLTFEERTLLFAASKSAVYSCFDYLVGYSILGGSVISGKQHGHLAAKMVIEICRGSNPDTIPVIQSPSMIMMDYPLMLRYGISETLLPPGSTIINKPFSFYATYRSLIWSVSGVFVILMCFIVFLTFNIIKRQRAERALLAEHERLEVTIASIADAVIATDVKGRIVLMNQVAQELTGWPLPLARHMDLNQVFTIIDKDTRVPLENPVEAVLKQRTILEIARNSILVSRDGVERLITDSVAPIIDSRKEIQGVVLVFRDITEKHHLDIEMEKAQKIQSIGLLAGGIAHDFNNYLTGILGNLSLMSMELPEQASLRSLADDAIQAVMRAKSLTQQLLTFSKGGEPVREVTKLDDLLRENVTFNLHGSSLSCVFDIEDGLWNAEIDPAQISQVITNLVINAREAMPQGGEIRVTARNTVIRGNESLPMAPGDFIRVDLADNGPGIPEKDLPRIFDPYFSTKTTGSGIGLTVSYSIIRKHDGYLTVSSKSGEGSVFSFFLPATQKSLPPSLTAPPCGVTSRGRVLLMDDDPLIRRTGERLLTGLGYDVTCASDGGVSAALFQEAFSAGNGYRLVILDLTVPGGMGGKEVISRLREIDPMVKAIVSSGYSTDPVMANHRQYGFDGVLQKPYTLEEIKAVLQNIEMHE